MQHLNKSYIIIGAIILLGFFPLWKFHNASASHPLSSSGAPVTYNEDQITIHSPSSNSQLLSPLQIDGEIKIITGNSLRLELIREDGQSIARKVFACVDCESNNNSIDTLISYPKVLCKNNLIRILTTLEFEISQERSPARLQIAILDDQKQIRLLQSVDIILLSKGKPIINPSREKQKGEELIIQKPTEGESLKGNKFFITGTAPRTNILPLRIEVFASDGKLLSTRMATVSSSSLGDPLQEMGIFSSEINIKLKNPTQALIIVSIPAENIKGLKTVQSRKVFLFP